MARIFVYGTLKRGQERNGILVHNDGHCLGVDTVLGYDLRDLGPYPMIVEGQHTVHGEVWDIPDALLEYLDFIEGTQAGLYSRQQTYTQGGQLVVLYVYGDFATQDGELIPEGRWPRHAGSVDRTV
jgi:gamma-glutamylcyclotransferase (GGCT)/AIG2-like uncharacterized protein YtfP